MGITEWTESKEFCYDYDKEKNAIIFNLIGGDVTKRILEYLVKNAKVLPEDFSREFQSSWIERRNLYYIKKKGEKTEIKSKRQSTAETQAAFEYAHSLLYSNREEALKLSC